MKLSKVIKALGKENLISLSKTFFKLCIYKIKYGSKLNVSIIQDQWGKNLSINIEKTGNVQFGRYVWFRDNVRLDCAENAILTLGNRVFCNNGTYISARKKIIIGNNTIMGPNVMIFDHDHDYKNNLIGFTENEIVIGENVWIGANAVILRGTKIGDNAVIGAGCVIKGEIPPKTVVTSKENIVIRKY